jgi:hypothetical protein
MLNNQREIYGAIKNVEGSSCAPYRKNYIFMVVIEGVIITLINYFLTKSRG